MPKKPLKPLSINCAPKPLLLREVILTNSLLMYFIMLKLYTIFHQNISTLIIHMEQSAHFPPLSQPNWQKANRLSNPWRLLKVLLLMPFNTVLSSGKETGRPIIGGI